MTDKQPEALRLAAYFDDLFGAFKPSPHGDELRRLHQHELCNKEWLQKTEWVQETLQPMELGMHRADVLKKRIERLHEVNESLLQALKDAVDSMEEWGAMASVYEQERYGLQTDLNMARAAIAKGVTKE